MHDDPITPLAAEFDPPDEAAWRALAEKALKGAPFERLTTQTADGVAIAPLYRAPDVTNPAGSLVQEAKVDRDAYLPWDIRQPFNQPDPVALNRMLLDDLQGGTSSVEIVIDDGRGIGLGAVSALPSALEGVLLDLAPVALSAGWLGIPAATSLAEHLARTGKPASPAFNIDPLRAWLTQGGAPQPIANAVSQAASAAKDLAQHHPTGTALRVDGRSAHEAGASPVQELSLMLASGAVYLRSMDAVGAAPAAAAKGMLFCLAVGSDVIVEIAKLRAARALWANLMAACGADKAAVGMRLQAISSRRMLTRDDAWTNILRSTAACFAASTGGADIITVLPFTAPLQASSPLARRLARNTQIILMEECKLGHVIDPGGGSFAVEALTQQLAEQAWEGFQAIEANGGLLAAAQDGSLQRAIAQTQTRRTSLVATRRQPITGISDFPILAENTPETDAPAASPPIPQSIAHDPIEPLAWQRLSEPFEALRDRAKASNPKVFFANLGPLAEFSARANFAANLFAAGGVAAVGADVAYADHAGMAAALKASGCRVAVLTGSDTRYAVESLEAAKALKAAGCDWLIHAGKPADEQAVRAKGFDQFIFAGQDAVAALRLLQTALGIV